MTELLHHLERQRFQHHVLHESQATDMAAGCGHTCRRQLFLIAFKHNVATLTSKVN